jgi:hypothetical protein
MCAAGKGSIDTGDNACTSLCCDRYLDTFNEVRKKKKVIRILKSIIGCIV